MPCAVCHGVAMKRCGGCHEVSYCSKDHQRVDWIRHKLKCRPFKVSESEVLGRFLVATRDIKAGEVVVRETALVQGPSQVTGPVCLGCLQRVTQHNSEPCEQCGWPLCRKPSCRQSKHHLPECRWTVEKRKSPVKISQFVNPHPSYECVTALRLCYAKRHNPDLWSRLSSLETQCEQRRGTAKYQQDSQSVAQFLRRFYKLDNDFTDDEILDIWGIIQINGHEVPISDPPHVAVYDLVSMLEHSCVPNCSKSFSSEGDVIIRAMTNITQGHHLSISYTDCLWGTSNRQFHLQDTKYFTCQCARCVDPTELGTFFSALLCEDSICKGEVLYSEAQWRCQRCSGHVEESRAEGLLQAAGQELSTLGRRPYQDTLTFLDHWTASFHPNHYYFTEAKLALAQRLGQDGLNGIQDLEDEELRLKADLCYHLVNLLSVIAPAECRVLGTLHFELHAALAEQGRRDHIFNRADLRHCLLESRKCLVKAIYYLEQEPEILPEGKLLIQSVVNKAQLDKVLQEIESTTSSIPFI